ncbi:SEC-C domain-containing protein [Patescibacteria group bacterium]|nr:SEC-C domain-containing protein [Patescibacteria group bacterium]
MPDGTKRNLKCPCGSGKKFKKCCQLRNKKYNALILELEIKDILEKSRPKFCYFKNENCSEKIIKAHSIQNNKILKNISKNGEVYVYDFTNDGALIKLKGKKIATTFTGLCGYHDKILFKSIDDSDYLHNNKEQNFSFSLRALVFELYAKEHAMCFINKILNKKGINKNLILYREGLNISIIELKSILKNFKESNETKNYEIIRSFSFELNKKYLIAVNSAFTLEYDLEGNIINDFKEYNSLKEEKKLLFLNIFPQKEKTIIIFSWLSRDNFYYSKFKNQLISLNENEKIRILNLIISYYIENIAINPDIWGSLKKEEKENFIFSSKRFIKTQIKKDALKKCLTEDIGFNIFK